MLRKLHIIICCGSIPLVFRKGGGGGFIILLRKLHFVICCGSTALVFSKGSGGEASLFAMIEQFCHFDLQHCTDLFFFFSCLHKIDCS